MKKILSRIAVCQIKGGVGKTRVALNLAMTLDFGVITNDQYSVVERILSPERRKILGIDEKLPEIPPEIPIIFDFGGYPDVRMIEALRQSQFVLTPVLPHKEDLQIALDFIQDIKKYNKNIIIIVNRTKAGDFDKIRRVFKNFYPELAIFEIKESRVMSHLVEQKASVREIACKDKLHRKPYGKVARQFDTIINYMSGRKI